MFDTAAAVRDAGGARFASADHGEPPVTVSDTHHPSEGATAPPAPGAQMQAEVASQPALWAQAARRLPEVAHLLPSPGESVAVVGCGTSLFMAQAYAALREDAGHGTTDAWPASEHRLARGYDRVLALTRSGTTTEVLELLRDLPGSQARTVVTADPGTPAVDLADPLVLADADERSVVQTRFATTALALLRASLGQDLSGAVADAEEVLAAGDDAVPQAVLDAEQITFVGRGWTVGLAHEAALKLRESAQAWTESYPAMEYRHGPISISTTGRATWAFGEVPDGLADDVRATGAHLEHSALDPLADLVRVHLLCLARARRAGLDPDSPRHLTRSIILDR
jgi:fructoselysine-6-P-deglycase FrlB-like protein